MCDEGGEVGVKMKFILKDQLDLFLFFFFHLIYHLLTSSLQPFYLVMLHSKGVR